MSADTVHLGDLTVPRMGYGAMRLTGPGIWGPPADRDEALRVLRRAVELGVRVIDCAWYYGPEVSQELIATALSPYPEDLVLVTKLGGARSADKAWHSALTSAELREGCERDLRLLGLDSVPVTHLRWMEDSGTSFEDALATMIDLHREGKIERLGLSNVSLAQLDAALAETPIVSVSNLYGHHQRADDPMVERCTRDGIAYLPFFPLAMGRSARDTALGTVAARLAATPSQVAIAWLLARSPVILPIPGTSRVAHLEQNVAAASLALSAEDLALLDGAAAA